MPHLLTATEPGAAEQRSGNRQLPTGNLQLATGPATDTWGIGFISEMFP